MQNLITTSFKNMDPKTQAEINNKGVNDLDSEDLAITVYNPEQKKLPVWLQYIEPTAVSFLTLSVSHCCILTFAAWNKYMEQALKAYFIYNLTVPVGAAVLMSSDLMLKKHRGHGIPALSKTFEHVRGGTSVTSITSFILQDIGTLTELIGGLEHHNKYVMVKVPDWAGVSIVFMVLAPSTLAYFSRVGYFQKYHLHPRFGKICYGSDIFITGLRNMIKWNSLINLCLDVPRDILEGVWDISFKLKPAGDTGLTASIWALSLFISLGMLYDEFKNKNSDRASIIRLLVSALAMLGIAAEVLYKTYDSEQSSWLYYSQFMALGLQLILPVVLMFFPKASQFVMNLWLMLSVSMGCGQAEKLPLLKGEINDEYGSINGEIDASEVESNFISGNSSCWNKALNCVLSSECWATCYGSKEEKELPRFEEIREGHQNSPIKDC